MQEGVGPRFVEPIINASIAITASLLDLNPQELTLESNVPVVGKLAYGTLDFMINGKQVFCSGPHLPHLANRESACMLQCEVSDQMILPQYMQCSVQGGVPIKVSEAEQAFTSADEAQLLVQMATVRDISETADQASTANANLMHVYIHWSPLEALRCQLCHFLRLLSRISLCQAHLPHWQQASVQSPLMGLQRRCKVASHRVRCCLFTCTGHLWNPDKWPHMGVLQVRARQCCADVCNAEHA